MRQLLFFLFLLFALFATDASCADVVDLSRLDLPAESLSPAATPETIDLGRDQLRGIEARARLLAPTPARDDSGQMLPWKILVEFKNRKTGEMILAGQAAVRVFPADQGKPQTVRLEMTEQNWMADILPLGDGETMIKVGSKLIDGKKRIYRFFYRTPHELNLSPDAQPTESP